MRAERSVRTAAAVASAVWLSSVVTSTDIVLVLATSEDTADVPNVNGRVAYWLARIVPVKVAVKPMTVLLESGTGIALPRVIVWALASVPPAPA